MNNKTDSEIVPVADDAGECQAEGGMETTTDQQEPSCHPIRLIESLAVIGLATCADLCLYGMKVVGGTGFAALLVLSLCTLGLLRRGPAIRTVLPSAILLLALCGMLVWRTWWLVVALSGVCLAQIAVRLWRPDWSLLEAIAVASASIVHGATRLADHVFAFTGILKRKAGTARQGVRPRVVLIPLVVSVVFLLIFKAANPVVARAIDRLEARFTDVLMHLGDYISVGRIAFWCGWLMFFAGLIRPIIGSELIDKFVGLDVALDRNGQESDADDGGEGQANFSASFWTLICVNLMFLVYNCTDSIYLYFKATLPSGITWTAYTHAGCGWLTFGLFLSSVVLGTIFWNRLNFHPGVVRLKMLAYVWVFQNAVLAFGTLRRIHMYIDYSGLTHLLLTGVYGSLLVMAGLGIMIVKVRNNRSAVWLVRKYALALALGLVVLGLTPHGWVCAKYNVARVRENKPRALRPICLKKLPPDALPVVAGLLEYKRDDGDLTKQTMVREGVAAILGQHIEKLEAEGSTRWSRWQASSSWALKRLRLVKDDIMATLPRERWIEAQRRLVSDYDLSGAP